MYLPSHFAIEDLDEIVATVESIGAIDLITSDTAGRPHATLMPVIWDRSDWSASEGNYGVLRMHMARANQHWQTITDGAPALAIVHGPQAYVSPSNYENKHEHGKVVPTWNYLSIHFEGEVFVDHDVEQLRKNVSELTNFHEAQRDHPWQVSDAPEQYLNGQLRGIVGITMRVTELSGKAKLSQNRSSIDRTRVADDLRRSDRPGDKQIAELIDKTLL